MTRLKSPPLVVCCALAAFIVLAPQSRASIISFTSDAGSNGFLIEDGTPNTHVGTFFFNIFDGNPSSIGVDIIGSWSLPGEVTGFHLDFTGAFASPRTIASAQFTNENDLVNNSDDVIWPTTITGITTAAGSTAPGDTIANGEWFDDQVRFTTTTQGSLGFTGYFVVQDSASAPEPSTCMLLFTGLGLILGGRTRLRNTSEPRVQANGVD